MPTIKPLEEAKKQPSIYRILFLVALVTAGILLNQVFLKQKTEIPSILGKTKKVQLQTQKELVQQVQNNNLIKVSLKKAEEIGGSVLGEATVMANKLASDAGSFMSTIIYENSIGKVVDQIEKLPKDQQEKIRERICK